jgi:hypothetical protein
MLGTAGVICMADGPGRARTFVIDQGAILGLLSVKLHRGQLAVGSIDRGLHNDRAPPDM